MPSRAADCLLIDCLQELGEDDPDVQISIRDLQGIVPGTPDADKDAAAGTPSAIAPTDVFQALILGRKVYNTTVAASSLISQAALPADGTGGAATPCFFCFLCLVFCVSCMLDLFSTHDSFSSPLP